MMLVDDEARAVLAAWPEDLKELEVREKGAVGRLLDGRSDKGGRSHG